MAPRAFVFGLLIVSSFISLAFSQSGSYYPESIRPELLCGSKNGTAAAGLNFCSNFNGLSLDSFWFGNLTITQDIITAYDSWALEAFKTFNSSLKSSCPACTEWLKVYVCSFALPGKGYSQCYEKKWWDALRKDSKCTNCATNNTLCVGDCCPCSIADNSTCDPSVISVSEIEDIACGPVSQDTCLNTFSVCLNLTRSDPKVTNLCSYWSPSKVASANAITLPNDKLPPLTTCPADFAIGIESFLLLNSNVPMLRPKGCTPKWVTPTYKKTSCTVSILGIRVCTTTTTAGKPYLTCSDSSATIPHILLVLLFIFFSFVLF